LLWQGELEWNRTRSLEKTMGLIRSALEQGFRAETDRDKKYDEADREYAEGLVAETVDLAVKHFRKAIEKVKSHHRANRMLGLLLILTGSIREARALIAVAELLFPDDPTFKILEAWAAAAENQLPSARDRLGKLASPPADRSRPILSEEQVKWARDIAELVDQIR